MAHNHLLRARLRLRVRVRLRLRVRVRVRASSTAIYLSKISPSISLDLRLDARGGEALRHILDQLRVVLVHDRPQVDLARVRVPVRVRVRVPVRLRARLRVRVRARVRVGARARVGVRARANRAWRVGLGLGHEG